MVVSASINQVLTEITTRSYAWSYGHSDPDPSNVTSTHFPHILSMAILLMDQFFGTN